eukprot:1610284-Alexandrium_andersonii.AAC.1
MASFLPPPPPPWFCQGNPCRCAPRKVTLMPNAPIRYGIAEPPPPPPWHVDGVRVPVPRPPQP